MHTKRLFLADLSDEHLTLMLRGVQYSYDAKIEDWLRDLNSGMLAVFELDSRGIIGLRKQTDCLFVEFVVGKNLRPIAKEAMAWLQELADGRKIEALAMRPALIRYYQTLGFRPIATWMRFDNGRI